MSTNKFHFESLNDDTKVIRTGQVLDNSNADKFSTLIMDFYDNNITNIYIDMTLLEFLSSAGIGSILGTMELFRERQGDIILTNVGSKIIHILDVLNLTEYLTIYKSLDEALTQVGK